MQPTASPPRLTSQNGYGKLTDVELVRRATSGDKVALDVLVERHSPRVNRIAAQVVGDLEEARDAAQESLVKLCTRLRQFRGEAQFATWLHRLVVNTCRDRLARQRVRRTEPLLDEDRPAGDEADPSYAALIVDLREDLVEALARLSPAQRAAFVLRSLGLSYEEIARAARIPVGTAKCYVHRARARLRAGLQEHAAA